MEDAGVIKQNENPHRNRSHLWRSTRHEAKGTKMETQKKKFSIRLGFQRLVKIRFTYDFWSIWSLLGIHKAFHVKKLEEKLFKTRFFSTKFFPVRVWISLSNQILGVKNTQFHRLHRHSKRRSRNDEEEEKNKLRYVR